MKPEVIDYTTNTKYSSENKVNNESVTYHTFVHGCCEKGSLLTRPTALSSGCKFLEITKEHDMRTREAIDACKQSIKGPEDTFFWCSPCTGGSSRQTYNIAKAFQTGNLGTLYKIRGHRELHEQLKPAFFECAEHSISVGAKVIVEWPDGCLYHDDPDYVAFFEK